MTAKKAAERRLVDQFLAAWSGREAIKSFDPEWEESPDFIGELGDGRSFGLEVVSITAHDVARSVDVVERFKKELSKAARATSTFASFVINLDALGAHLVHDRKYRKTLIDRLLRFARAFPRQRPKELYGRKLEGRGISGLDRVAVFPTPTTSAVGIARSVMGEPALVYDRIAQKNAKADYYRSRLPSGAELWLLLVAGADLASSLSAPMSHEPIATPFDRVFFLDLWPVRAGQASAHVRELRIKRLANPT